MAIKPSDVKRLWGRSGARCALCRQELSPVGESALLGEMAHIVAQSEEGPRGSNSLPLSERDRYENLILVCPTDHTRIDNNVEEWPIDRLQAEKLKHEHWLQGLLDNGSALPVEIDSSQFREERAAQWVTEPGSWMCVALTPLQIIEDAIDPLAGSLCQSLRQSKLPPYLGTLFGTFLNRVEPSAHGLVAENFSRVSDGMGYRIEVFRNGHVEYMVCLSAMFDRFNLDELRARTITRGDWMDSSRKVVCTRVLDYSLWANTLGAQLGVLHALWEKLPFNDMVLSMTVFNLQGTSLVLGSWPFYFVGGRAVEKPLLTHSVVVPRNSTQEDLTVLLLSRFVNYFGLTLPEVFDQEGKLCQPTLLG
jgi:hypothetical protein